MPLTPDEFRLLAFLRGYADGWGDGHHLDPSWIADHLEFDPPRMRSASRRLASLGLVTLSEFNPHPDPTGDPLLTDICLTEQGWNHLQEPPPAPQP